MGMLGPCIGAIGPSAEACNNIDDDCNGQVDEGLGTVTCGIGACQRTASACVDGGVGMCSPGAPVAEICSNNLDDDCDGVINNGCACIHVEPNGNDNNTGSAASPLRHITAGVAKAVDAGINVVCVASVQNCPSTFDYGGGGGESVNMANGISVLGRYQTGSWTRGATCVTRITALTAQGVVFDHPVTAPTSIDGFDLVGGDFATSAAVTVRGSTGAVINDDTISGGSGNSVTTSIGVDVVDVGGIAATPIISASSVAGAPVAGTSIGVRSTNSAPVLARNCSQFDASGRCSVGCGTNNPVQLSIKGAMGAAGDATNTAIGVLLDSSPNALIDTSAICDVAPLTLAHANGTGVKIQGNAAGSIVRRNDIIAFGASATGVGVWADPCNGAAPRISDNLRIAAASAVGGSRSDGIRAIGACHPVIDLNLAISGGVEQAGQDTNGVYCARDMTTGVSSQCTVLSNVLISGSTGGFPPHAVGVRCDDGACLRIDGNGLITGRGGVFAAGVVVSKAGPVIARNTITAGCGLQTAIGLQSLDSFARVENNVIHGLNAAAGTACVAGAALQQSYAVQVVTAAGNNELHLHSNSLFGDGLPVPCVSRALTFDATDAGPPPSAPRGVVRNNVLSAGVCSTRYDLQELNVAADPRVLQNNWFDRTPLGTVFYRDEASTDLTDAGAVNALTDITASGNIEGMCGVTSANFHLPATSVCRNAGTDAGAPAIDFDGDKRPQEGVFDIGADEYVP
jgi:hypothetical protein